MWNTLQAHPFVQLESHSFTGKIQVNCGDIKGGNSSDNYFSNTHVNDITIESCSENPSVYWQKMDLCEKWLQQEECNITKKEAKLREKNPNNSG